MYKPRSISKLYNLRCLCVSYAVSCTLGLRFSTNYIKFFFFKRKYYFLGHCAWTYSKTWTLCVSHFFALVTPTHLFHGLGTTERGVDRNCEKAEVGQPVEMCHHQVDGWREEKRFVKASPSAAKTWQNSSNTALFSDLFLILNCQHVWDLDWWTLITDDMSALETVVKGVKSHISNNWGSTEFSFELLLIMYT